jgi:hypothetical protein
LAFTAIQEPARRNELGDNELGGNELEREERDLE